MPTYNPLVGWLPDDRGLVGYGGSGIGAGAGIGYDGTVGNLGDFAKAVAGGAGVVMGGLPGFLGMMGNVAAGNSPTAGLTGLLQSARDWATGSTQPTAPVVAVHSADLAAPGIMGMEPAGQQVNLEGTGGAGGASQESKNAEAKASFAMGGYTGGVEGRPAGVVHGQELVLAAPTVRALGPVADDLARVNALAVERAPMRPRSWAEMVMMQHPDIWNAAA